MDLHRLQVFIKVYEFRSFSRAAEEVLLSQPTVSGHIKILEEELGVTLFDRLGREVLPTRVAELLYSHAINILAKVHEASQEIDAFLSRLRGSLKLGGSTIPGEYILPGLMGQFKKQHPEVRMSLNISGSAAILDQVLSGMLDLAVTGMAPGDERLASKPLWSDVVVFAAPPDHPLAQGPVELGALVKTPLVMREPGSGTMLFVLEALKKAGLKTEHLNIEAQLASNEAVLQGIKAGLGIGFASSRAIAKDLEHGHLKVLDIGGLDLHRCFHLVTRKDRTHSPAAQTFIELCLGDNGKKACME